MSFLQSILTEKQLANVIIFGVTFGPLLTCFLIHEAFAIRSEVARLRSVRVTRPTRSNRHA
jgi:hypothetical protein